MLTETVPFTDLSAMTRDVRAAVEHAWANLLESSRFVGGEPVADFEQKWASYCGASEAVGVGSGTDSLLLTLRALDIGAGDEVIVPANTFVASVEAVVLAGATPHDGTGHLVTEEPGSRGAYHLAVARVPDRAVVRRQLAEAGIETQIHYPVPCHRQAPYRRFATRPLPVAEESANDILSLPIFPHMDDDRVVRVCGAVSAALGAKEPSSHEAVVSP